MKYEILDFYPDIYEKGLFIENKLLHIKVESTSSSLALLIYKRNEEEAIVKIPFNEKNRVGNIWILHIKFKSKLKEDLEYNFIDEKGNIFEDRYGKVFSGHDSFGKAYKNNLRSKIFMPSYDWEDEKRPNIKIEDNIIYKLNVRTFTKSSSSKVVHKGTFKGIIEKLAYIKDLGVNTLLLMPCMEFDELRKDAKIDVWGYEKTRHFAPKASFCTKKQRNPINEYKDMVKALHKAKIEIWQEFYFDKLDIAYSLDVLRYWVREYHIDGIYLSGSYDANTIIKDAYLSKIKIITSNEDISEYRNNVLAYNDSFLNTLRRFLKGDEGTLYEAFSLIKANPRIKKIKYMADILGFSLMDCFSYDMKHNEANGENNKDGKIYNYSWNCGIEGSTKKKKVLELREKLYRNALVFVFLSVGIPLIAAGDEFGDTREGNNNAYCQDNELSYLDWKKSKKYKSRIDFVKYLILFRNKYQIFRKDKEFTMLDTLSCGMPDISVHSKEVWKNDFAISDRQLGLYYCGKYQDSMEDIYILYNMHWERHSFALPRIAKNRAWYLCFDTDKDYKQNFNFEKIEKLAGIKEVVLEARSIICLLVK